MIIVVVTVSTLQPAGPQRINCPGLPAGFKLR